MDDVDEGTPEVDGIRTLAEQAARVQDVLGDLDLALVPGGETPAMRLLGELKRAWRD
jgi:peptidase E